MSLILKSRVLTYKGLSNGWRSLVPILILYFLLKKIIGDLSKNVFMPNSKKNGKKIPLDM